MKIKPYIEFINEKNQFFDSQEKIKIWLKKRNIDDYIINEDLSVDVNDNVELTGRITKELCVSFNKVNGYFLWQGGLQTKSLMGCPKEVCGDVALCGLGITSLKGSPTKITEQTIAENYSDYSCYNNKLTSLEGSPDEISNGGFNCKDNKLTDLIGGPKIVMYRYMCCDNELTSLDGAPLRVGPIHHDKELYYDKYGNDVKFICNNNNKITTLKGLPLEFDNLYKLEINTITNMQKCSEEWLREVFAHNISLYTNHEEWIKNEASDKFKSEYDWLINASYYIKAF